ncbi:D-alanyl-D-alanine carboxypeptidase family protein [Actinomadura roseirufa]|uniref:D-alanyl-D-alanine carboxypeptidase family protein n=1 Tax=Actinomadura roseirufa TaxID=2094049 RepID=UPI0010417675|nr:serine hydrolase [Actinomadura roseirufa]
MRTRRFRTGRGATVRSTVRATVLTAVLIAVLTAAALVVPAPASASARSAGPAVAARSGLLYDLAARRTLWSRAADTVRPIASITKVMTALVALDGTRLDRTIRIEDGHVRYPERYDGSSAGLRAGDLLTVRQLLHALLLASGCDAAYALADALGPGRERFVARMNGLAARLGMTRTTYANFDGLPWPTATSTSSTARDQVRLAAYALRDPEFAAIVARRSYGLPHTRAHRAYTWTNTNRLIGGYAGATGVKTGFTDAAGYSLLFSARRGRRSVAGVVLNSSTTDPASRFTDAARLLDWAFTARSPSRAARPAA